MRHCLWLLLIVSVAQAAPPENFGLVKPTQSWRVLAPRADQPRFDPSGLLRFKGQWLVVSDRPEYNDIYRLQPVKGSTEQLQAQTFLSPKLPAEYAQSEPKLYDFEALAWCGDYFAIAEEQQRLILKVAPKSGRTTVMKPDFTQLHAQRRMAPPFLTPSDGFEGFACDLVNQRLYAAHERQMRLIYPLDWQTFQPLDFFDLPAGWHLPRHEAGFDIFPDFADLHFKDGFLYALVRNDNLILKIDPVRKIAVAMLEFDYAQADLYAAKEPFGMAEGLFVEAQAIFILLDNNGVAARANANDVSARLLEFKRPDGF